MKTKENLTSLLKIVNIPNYGDIMPMKEFIACCECGGFIDYDGFAHPIVNNKMIGTIRIKPSDIVNGHYLQFKKVIWFNR